MLGFQLENVKTFVVCAGLLYGAGEDALERFFQSAWLQKPAALPVPGHGENQVPAIHVKDLTSFVLRIADAPPEHKYHFAFDGNKDRTLRKIIQDISVAAGSGETEVVEHTDLLKDQFLPLMHIDFWALPSDMLIAVPLQWTPEEIEKMGQPKPDPVPAIDADPAADPPQDDPAPEPQDPDFEWTSKTGIGANGKPILAEFCKVHSSLASSDLRHLNVFVHGEEGSKKDEFCAALSSHYYVPIITLRGVFEHVERHCSDELLAADFKEELENIRALLDQRVYVACAHKNLPFNETAKVFYRCIKYRLSQNDCFNRGYIFNDPVLGEKDLDLIFKKLGNKKLKRKRPKPKKSKKNKTDQSPDAAATDPADNGPDAPQASNPDDGADAAAGEEEQGDAAVGQEEQAVDAAGDGQDGDAKAGEEEQAVDDDKDDDAAADDGEPEEEGPKHEDFLPESFIFFEKEKDTFRFEEDELDVRKAEILDYCDKMKIESLTIDLSASTEHEGLEDLRLYIERVGSDKQNGRPFNYLTQFDELKTKHQDYYKTIEHRKEFIRSETTRELERQQSSATQSRLKKVLRVVEEIEETEASRGSSQEEQVRRYLSGTLTPVISEGLLKLVEIKPADPVDYLAEYLFERSYEY